MHVPAFLFIFLFGVAALVGLWLGWYWGRTAYRRLSLIDHPWHQDRYFIVAISFALVATGQAAIDIGRTVGNVRFGLSRILLHWEGLLIFGGMLVLLVGLVGMVWLADLETHPPNWRWLRRMAVLTAVWAGLSLALHTVVPIIPRAGA